MLMFFQEKNKDHSFTILLAVIVIAVMLGLSLTAFSLVFGELEFSRLGRISQLAFYAADSGAECALYWDIVQTPSAFSDRNYNIYCGGQSISGLMIASSTFFTLKFENNTCADIKIDKSNSSYTSIRSYGHYPCRGGSRRVERALLINY